MSKQNKIHLSPPHMSGNEKKYIEEAFQTNWIAPLGPNLDAFEKEARAVTGAKEAVAVSSGTAAIHLALSLLDITKGDTVFCSTLTFVATANPILYQGAEPVFIDSEPETWNMSPQALEKAMQDALSANKLPKAVIVVHLYGQPAKMDELLYICNRYNVPVIEDAAESLGASYKGKASGTMGKFGIYSFNGNKIITTSGGGMIVSDDTEAMQRLRFLATQARDQAPHYQHSELGFNYRMSNILAGVGIAQMKVLKIRVEARRKIFNRYVQQLAHIPGFMFMPELAQTTSNRWLTALTIDEHHAEVTPVQIIQALDDQNIEARHVWKPLHLQPLFQGAAYYPHDAKKHVAEELFRTGICLPSGSCLSETDQQRIIDCITSELEHAGTVKEVV